LTGEKKKGGNIKIISPVWGGGGGGGFQKSGMKKKGGSRFFNPQISGIHLEEKKKKKGVGKRENMEQRRGLNGESKRREKKGVILNMNAGRGGGGPWDWKRSKLEREEKREKKDRNVVQERKSGQKKIRTNIATPKINQCQWGGVKAGVPKFIVGRKKNGRG